MGIYRSSPLKDKNTEVGENERISYAASGMQGTLLNYLVKIILGWRISMEDSHIADLKELGDNKYIFGVFDGHGGKSALILLNIFRYGSS